LTKAWNSSVVFSNFDLGMSKKVLFIYTTAPQYAI